MTETKKVPKKLTIHIFVRKKITFNLKNSSEVRSVSTAIAYNAEEPELEIIYS